MDETLADVVKGEVETNRVRLYPGHVVERIEKSNKSLTVVCADLKLEADMVLVAIGITPDNRLAANANIELGVSNSISVDKGLKTSDKNIFAAGDCADAYHVVTGRKVWIPLALRANRAGWAEADSVYGWKT